jgi:hypothetical protein
MDIHVVVREVVRVLAPGGMIIATHPLLPFLIKGLPHSLRHPGEILRKSIALANSLSYGWFGRRVFRNDGSASTARPVYLTRRQIIATLEKAGLRVRSVIDRGNGDIILVAEKPAK